MSQTKTEQLLGSAGIGRLIVRLAVPSIIAQVINLLYNIVDRIYIGRIPQAGELALTGVGLSMPVVMALLAVSSLVGGGGAPLAAIALGRGDREHAERILGSGAAILAFCSVLIMALLLPFKTPLLYLFGASENTVGYADAYLTIYLWGAPFTLAATGLNSFISCQGQARTAMLSVLIGAVLNIALDPVFIFTLDMGVSGAALATVISQAVSAVWVVAFLAGKKSTLRLRAPFLRPSSKIVWQICQLGVSPFIMQATESVLSIVLNSGLSRYGGDLYVGALTILSSVRQLFSVPISGFANGVQPIISYNFGARKFDRVKKTCRILILSTFCASFAGAAVTMLLPSFFARLFTTSEALITLTAQVLPYYMAGLLIFGLQNGVQSAFLGLGQAKVSVFIALLRKVFLLIPLALVLPVFFGVRSIYLAESIADVLSASCAGVLFLVQIRKILASPQSGAPARS